MKLTKDNVKNLTNRRSKIIHVGEYEIKIIEMTIPQQLEIESILKEKKSNSDLIIPVIKFSVVDDNNQMLLDDEIINNLPAHVAAELFKHCIEFNSIDEKDLENRAKNS